MASNQSYQSSSYDYTEKTAYEQLINNNKDNESIGSDGYTEEDLLDPNMMALKRCDQMIKNMHKTTTNTIDIGAGTLSTLKYQGDQIINMNTRTHRIIDNTSFSDRVLSKMLCSAKKHQVIIVLIIIILIAIAIMLLILKLK